MAVLGPGLIGGSVLRALRKRDPEVHLRAWARREAAVEQIRADGGLAGLASTNLEEVVEGVDLIVLAMPVQVMPTVAEQLPAWPSGRGPIVTDVGSVKASVVHSLAPAVRDRGGEFLGSHPMAGSEKTGLEHAEADLFEGAAVILTPDQDSTPEALESLRRFWEGFGAIVSEMAPPGHDEAVAAISHLPHLAAAALVRSVLGEEESFSQYCGGGFCDTTRVAGGPPEMWAEILADNREAVSRGLGNYIDELQAWKEALDTLDTERLRGFLSRARELRRSI